MMSQILLVFISCFPAALGQQFHPVPFTLPSPPSLTGAYTPNYVLYHVEKLANNIIYGPASFAFINGDVLTVTGDNKLVNIATCIPRLVLNLNPPFCNSAQTCGAIISIRVGINGQLLVVDAIRGLFQVNVTTGVVTPLYNSVTPVGGRRSVYLNDAVQAPDGTIYITDSSDKYDVFRDLLIIMEGRTSGRILALNPSTGVITEYLKDIIAYPNGIELTSDGKALLVSEAGRARILRVSLVGETPQVTIFANNLPGVPTNIRRSPLGTFWVALSLIRHSGIANSMDQYSNNPIARYRTVMTDSLQKIRTYYPNYGLVIEIHSNGTSIGSLHDPIGWNYASVTEAAEYDGLLYVGSSTARFAGRVVINQIGGRVPTNDSIMQIQRSRCNITEAQYQYYLKNKPQTTTTQNTAIPSSTTAGTTGGTTETTTAFSGNIQTTEVTQTTTPPSGVTDTTGVTQTTTALSGNIQTTEVTQTTTPPSGVTDTTEVTEESTTSSTSETTP